MGIFDDPEMMMIAGQAMGSGKTIGESMREVYQARAAQIAPVIDRERMAQQNRQFDSGQGLDRERMAQQNRQFGQSLGQARTLSDRSYELSQNADTRASGLFDIQKAQFDQETKQRNQMNNIMTNIGGGNLEKTPAGDLTSDQLYKLSDSLAIVNPTASKAFASQADRIDKKAELKVPDYEVEEGFKPSAEGAKKVKAANAGLKQMRDWVTDMKAFIDSEGTEWLGSDSDLMVGKMQQFALLSKQLFELGALQEADMNLVKGMMIDPSSFNALFTRNSAVVKSIDNVLEFSEKGVDSLAAANGYKKAGSKGGKGKQADPLGIR